MLKLSRILDSGRAAALVLACAGVGLLAACGQKGPLFLPTGEAASNRATLPQTLNPAPAASSAATGGTGTGTANPAPRP